MSGIVPVDPAVPAPQGDQVLPGTAERITRAVPPNTQRAYANQWRQFTQWCADHGRSALPCSPETLADYVAHLADLDRAPATIQQAIATIRVKHRYAGHKGAPDSEAALLVLRDHRRGRSQRGLRSKEAPPLTRDHLTLAIRACDPATLAGLRDRVVLLFGFALAGRRSELVALQFQDVEPDGHGGLDLIIRSSKTDREAVGEVVNVPAGQHVDTDPVSVLDAYLAALRDRGVDATRGPLLRAVTRYDRLYRHEGISDQVVTRIVRDAARRAGLPRWEKFTAHSLRAGFATTAAEEGIPQSHWAQHGRWSKTSPVAARYVRNVERRTNNPLKRMGL